MYFVRKITKTKKRTSKSSFIVSIPRKLQRKLESHDNEIAKRLANFSRLRYFCDDTEGSKCFMLSIWSCELPPNSAHDKDRTTTIQRSGRTSRYVIMPKKVCYRYGWGAGTELVIGLDYNIDEFVQGSIYKDGDFVPAEKKPEACVIKFQMYQDMKKLYFQRLAKKREDLARRESDAYWKTRNRPSYYDDTMDRIGYERKNMHRLVWNGLFQMNLVAVSYSDFIKLRAEMEKEKKKKRKKYLQKRFGNRATWRYRKDIVRSGKFSYDYDARRENMLDDPDSYTEARGDDPDLYGKERSESKDLYHEDEPEGEY